MAVLLSLALVLGIVWIAIVAYEGYEWERYTLTDTEYSKLEKHLGD